MSLYTLLEHLGACPVYVSNEMGVLVEERWGAVTTRFLLREGRALLGVLGGKRLACALLNKAAKSDRVVAAGDGAVESFFSIWIHFLMSHTYKRVDCVGWELKAEGEAVLTCESLSRCLEREEGDFYSPGFVKSLGDDGNVPDGCISCFLRFLGMVERLGKSGGKV
ncbi:hypothetical protein HK097_000563 [Rhizophlyctis rosea]|uniref:Uncharacterized protein n=1 Tax=Rhizophlyctis rosea TaxID=64517 RepID=A0AAD5SKH5_9FUNG|nr:hypothetical protein HK097_000563 [Rhizophlyctis rosea]